MIQPFGSFGQIIPIFDAPSADLCQYMDYLLTLDTSVMEIDFESGRHIVYCGNEIQAVRPVVRYQLRDCFKVSCAVHGCRMLYDVSRLWYEIANLCL